MQPQLGLNQVKAGQAEALHSLHNPQTLPAAVAMSMLGIHPSAIGNLWWHTGNPAVNNFGTGYQAVVIAMFAVAFPLTLLFRTWATSLATILLAGQLSEVVVEWGKGRHAGVQCA